MKWYRKLKFRWLLTLRVPARIRIQVCFLWSTAASDSPALPRPFLHRRPGKAGFSAAVFG